jgi:hypothetical protein
MLNIYVVICDTDVVLLYKKRKQLILPYAEATAT